MVVLSPDCGAVYLCEDSKLHGLPLLELDGR
jgi:hypothetical protein